MSRNIFKWKLQGPTLYLLDKVLCVGDQLHPYLNRSI